MAETAIFTLQPWPQPTWSRLESTHGPFDKSVSALTTLSTLSPANLARRRVETGHCGPTEYLSFDESAFALHKNMSKEKKNLWLVLNEAIAEISVKNKIKFIWLVHIFLFSSVLFFVFFKYWLVIFHLSRKTSNTYNTTVTVKIFRFYNVSPETDI